MSRRPAVHVRRYALYEEFIIPGDRSLPDASARRSTAGALLPFVGRAALAAGVTLLPLFAARLAGVAARRAFEPSTGRPPALPNGEE
jgi:hypothetical protein